MKQLLIMIALMLSSTVVFSQARFISREQTKLVNVYGDYERDMSSQTTLELKISVDSKGISIVSTSGVRIMNARFVEVLDKTSNDALYYLAKTDNGFMVQLMIPKRGAQNKMGLIWITPLTRKGEGYEFVLNEYLKVN